MPGNEDSAAARAIAERNRLFVEAYNAGDARRLVESYFVSDAIGPLASPPGGQPPQRGRAALIAMFEQQIRAAPSIRLQSESLTASDDVAFELGRAFLDIADGGRAIGRFTVCWVREAGEWRASIDFFTDDGWAD